MPTVVDVDAIRHHIGQPRGAALKGVHEATRAGGREAALCEVLTASGLGHLAKRAGPREAPAVCARVLALARVLVVIAAPLDGLALRARSHLVLAPAVLGHKTSLRHVGPE